MKFYVEINFRQGPTFSETLMAESKQEAKEHALRSAKAWGFLSPVKKIIIRSVS